MIILGLLFIFGEKRGVDFLVEYTNLEGQFMSDDVQSVIASMLNGTRNATYVIDLDNFIIHHANNRMKEIADIDMVGKPCYEVFSDANVPCIDCPFVQLKEDETRTIRQYSEMFDTYLLERITNVKWFGGKRGVMCSILNTEDIIGNIQTAGINEMLGNDDIRKEYQEKLRLSGELYSTVVAQIKTIVFEYNYLEETSYVSPLMADKFGISNISDLDFTKDDKTRSIIYPDDIDIYRMLFVNREDNYREVTCRFVDVNGNVLWYKVSIQIITDSDGRRLRAIGTLKDVDEATRSYEELKYRADYDMLTGLPNSNRFFIDALNLMQEDRDSSYAIIVFDIDKFKMINDLFDMRTGDEVLRHIGNILKEKMPTNSVCCRMHSDVFGMCIQYKKKGDIIKQIERLRKNIYINDFQFDINTTFGIYLPGLNENAVNLMCDRALLAAKTVKGNVVKFCAFYDEQYRADIIKTREIEQDMGIALLEKQFQMYLQPKFSLKDGSVVGAEVLARWNHPTKGLIQPNDFIPLFEKNGFILKLDEYMWEEACRTIRDWIDQGRKALPLAVNISRYHIKNNELVDVLDRLIKKYRIPSSMLVLEITETLFLDRMDEAYEILLKLQDKGFHLEVDDFGSGYSSLNMLRNIPVDTIKIDREFLDKKLSTDKGKIVISHTIAMAKDLKLGVIAEGVETKEHVKFLQESNCDIAQGFYFARPMPLEDFNKLSF